jgi:hypothetical protein
MSDSASTPTTSASGAGSLRRRRALGALLAALPFAAACGGAPEAGPGRGVTGTATAERATEAPTPAPPTPTAPPPTPTAIPRSPFTGREVADQAAVHRRIVAVKIDNAPLARPQLGLAYADLVYEMLAEGDLTRFMAMYLEGLPQTVGPVRSVRPTDIYLGQEWEFLLAYAGAGRTMTRLLGESLIPLFKAPELGDRLDGTAYFRDPRRPVPHNLFVHIDRVREAALQEPGIPPDVEIHPFPFREAPPEAGPLRTLAVAYPPPVAVTWRFEPETSIWKRSMSGGPHVDALNGQQIGVENILLQYAQVSPANVEPDAAGNPVQDTLLRGENTARLFHSGQIFEGVWKKEHDRAKTEYRLADGTSMPFRPGKVWIHILPVGYGASWS